MSNINLLPEELRQREQKELERLAKQRRVEKVELNRPLPVQQAIKKESDKPKKSWLKEFFGARPPKASPLVQTPAPVAKSSFDVDLLAASKKKQFNYKFGGKPQDFTKAGYAGVPERHPARPQPQQWQPRVAQPAAPRPQNGFYQQQQPRPAVPPAPYKTYAKPELKKSFWSKLFAKKPKAPKLPKPIPAPKPVIAPMPQPPKPAPAPVKPIKKEPRDSWWKIFPGLFSSSKKKNLSDLHLAGESARIMPAPAPVRHQANGHKPEIKPAQPSYHQAPPLQHSAVQVNLAKLPPAHHEPNFALMLIIFIGAWIFPVLLIYGSYTLMNYQQNKVDAQIAQQQQEMIRLSSQLSPYLLQQAQLDAFNGRLAALKSLLQNQNSWGPFFTLLEKYTLDDVYYRSLAADADGQVSLSAMAPTYQKVAEQTAVFSGAGDFIKDVKVNEAKEANDEKTGQVMINFLPRLDLAEGIFNNNSGIAK